LGVEIAKLPKGPLVTKAVVRTLESLMPPSGGRSLPLTNARVLIYGGGGHAKAVIDLLRQAGTFHIAGIIDDRIPPGTTVLGVPVLGARELLPTVLKDGVRLAVNAVVSLSDFRPRIGIFSMLAQRGFAFPIVRHRNSVVEISAALEDGIQIFANAYVGSEAVLKQGCIINSGAVVSHECVIGEYSHITPGAVLAGGVRVGARTLVGMGVTTAVGIDIGNDVRIGNSALVYQDVPDRTIISAGSSWPAPKRVK
jgi:sugar O-acyltransferase (sialic acid O-acetyltransferase NeuD family)